MPYYNVELNVGMSVEGKPGFAPAQLSYQHGGIDPESVVETMDGFQFETMDGDKMETMDS